MVEPCGFIYYVLPPPPGFLRGKDPFQKKKIFSAAIIQTALKLQASKSPAVCYVYICSYARVSVLEAHTFEAAVLQPRMKAAYLPADRTNGCPKWNKNPGIKFPDLFTFLLLFSSFSIFLRSIIFLPQLPDCESNHLPSAITQAIRRNS